MSFIKPGRLPLGPQKEKTSAAGSSSAGEQSKFSRDVWDDFAREKKPRKRKEYTKGTGDRMIPRDLEKDSTRKKRAPLFGEPTEELQSTDVVVENASEPILERSFGELSQLEDRLQYHFSDRTLLEGALTHRSALGMKERADYERLEFLGDAVLDLGIAHLLSDRHPNAREGELSKMRAALVNTQALAQIAKSLDIGPFIRLGRGEMASGGAERPSILADVMEAIVGAIYRDSSYDRSMQVVENIFGSELEQVTPSDPKTELQEMLHACGSEPPSYLLEMVEGPEHAPTFVTVVIVDGEIGGRGSGATKKAAQQAAAAEALSRLIPNAPMPELAPGQAEIIMGALMVAPQNGTPADQTI